MAGTGGGGGTGGGAGGGTRWPAPAPSDPSAPRARPLASAASATASIEGDAWSALPPWPALALPVDVLAGVGPARRRQLAALGLRTVGDVLRHLPRRHEDRSRVARLAEVTAPGMWTVAATVVDATSFRARRSGTAVLRARLTDGSAVLDAVWFNQPHLARLVVPGARLLLHGPAVVGSRGQPELRVPEVEARPAGGDGAEAAVVPAPGLVPVYPLAAGLTQRAMRAIVARAVADWAACVPETLPPTLRRELHLVPAHVAWRDLHLPRTAEDLDAARRRVAFEELLHLQLGLLLRRRERSGAVRGFRHPPPGDLSARFRRQLPFRLTAAQERVLREIEADLAAPRPMYRLLQGDVGSGKTVVAAAAMLRAVEGGRQAALLAPTEILAEQHYFSLRRLFAGLCRVELLTGSTAKAARRDLLAAVADGRVDVLVGTHALLQPDVAFRALALAVTDEQHRFGVRQRDLLAAKGPAPDVLVMTATPIPRTLAMTLYGDLDVSLLDELPPGRRPVRTFYRTPERREAVYAFLRDEVRRGRQAYVVCPLIRPGGAEAGLPGVAERALWEEVDGEDPRAAPVAAAEAAAGAEVDEAECAEPWSRALAERLGELRVGLLHGRMPLQAREQTMAAFVAGEIQVLVATTVIEVGVDVPNASVMVVEGADRFGLAQLHQLRGRVGRGPHPSYCILIARAAGDRLGVLTRTADGFAIAEEDLRQRGPGEVLGTRQHGLPDLTLADPPARRPAAAPGPPLRRLPAGTRPRPGPAGARRAARSGRGALRPAARLAAGPACVCACAPRGCAARAAVWRLACARPRRPLPSDRGRSAWTTHARRRGRRAPAGGHRRARRSRERESLGERRTPALERMRKKTAPPGQHGHGFPARARRRRR